MEIKDHFNKTFWLLAFAFFSAMVYVFAITFIAIPKDNIRFADTAQGFFLGTVVAGIIGYFCTGNPPQVKKTETTQPGTTTTADISVTQTKPEA